MVNTNATVKERGAVRTRLLVSRPLAVTRGADGARRAHPPRLGVLVGPLLVLVAWELLALYVFAGKDVMPTPIAVLRDFWIDRALLADNTGTTLTEAATGWLLGNALAVALALVFILVPMVEAVLLRLAIASYCLPIIAIAPILNIVFTGNQAKVYLAALAVFFTTLIGMVTGLRSPDIPTVDVIRAFGGNSWKVLVKVRVRYALPYLFAALRIAAPAAVLGAVIGEFLGGTSGIGVAMINAEQSVDVTRTWMLATWATILTGLGYLVTSLVARLSTPWSTSLRRNELGMNPPVVAQGLLYRSARSAGFAVLSLTLAIVIWAGGIGALHLNSYFAKSPMTVWRFLTSDAAAAANRSVVLDALGTTVRDAMLGFAAGTTCAILLAIACAMFAIVETTVVPVAIALVSIPLPAMTPLLALTFGRGILTVAVIAGIITFFPTLVNMVVGLQSAPRETEDLLRSLNASGFATLLKLRLPTALPALFASVRIAGPSALTGAVLAEWLATGKGLGYLMLVSDTEAQFSMLWTSAVVVTLVSILLYTAAGITERGVKRRFE